MTLPTDTGKSFAEFVFSKVRIVNVRFTDCSLWGRVANGPV